MHANSYVMVIINLFLVFQQNFTKENESLIKKFGMLKRYDDSQEFLLQNPHLTCEETANYLVIWCINLEVEEVQKFTIIFSVFLIIKVTI